MPRVTTLDKSLLLLEEVFRARKGIGTRALAERLGMNVATVHNIAHTFCAHGYLNQDPTSKHFTPGIRLMLMGRHPVYHNSLLSTAGQIVERIAAQLNESILLGSISQGRIINLKYVPSKHALRAQEPEDVSEHSYCTAFGKVLLSCLGETELEAYLQKTRLLPLTPRTLDTPEKLRKELEQVRQAGYARTCDEYCEGVSAVAVPILNPWGDTIASIGASAPTVRMQKNAHFKTTLSTLQQAAAEIQHNWNHAGAH